MPYTNALSHGHGTREPLNPRVPVNLLAPHGYVTIIKHTAIIKHKKCI